MTDLEDNTAAFKKRLDDLQVQHGIAASGDSLADIEACFVEWDQQLAARLREFHGQPGTESTEAAPVETPADEAGCNPPVETDFPGEDLSSKNIAAIPALVDRTLHAELDLARLPNVGGFRSPVIWAESSVEMRQALAAACGPVEPGAIDRLPATSLRVAHIPGEGTLVNRELVLRPQPGARQAVKETFARLAAEIGRERWGWGYLLEGTGLGQQAGREGLWPALTALRWKLAAPPGRNTEVAQALARSWLLTQAGWEDWVEQFLLVKSRRALGTQFYGKPRLERWTGALQRIAGLFPLYVVIGETVRVKLPNLAEFLRYLFLDPTRYPLVILNHWMIVADYFCQGYDRKVARHTGFPLSFWLGQFYFSRLECSVGTRLVPLALLIILNDENLLLAGLANGEALLERSKGEPKAHADTRLGLLSSIDTQLHCNPQALLDAAWGRFSLRGPE